MFLSISNDGLVSANIQCLKGCLLSSFACYLKPSFLLQSSESELYILLLQMESQTQLLTSSVEMKESIVDANLQLQETVNSLQK